jgi:hypothetical protein
MMFPHPLRAMPGGCRQLTAVTSTVEIDVRLAVGEFHVFSKAAGLGFQTSVSIFHIFKISLYINSDGHVTRRKTPAQITPNFGPLIVLIKSFSLVCM